MQCKVCPEDYRDIETVNMYKERLEKGYTETEIMESLYAKSRDNARTPMQWNEEKQAGFTDGEPWIKVNPDYTAVNARQQVADEASVFHCYKTLIALRKQYPVFLDGEFELLEKDSPNLFVYTRTNGQEEMLMYANFSDQEAVYELPERWKNAKVLICNEQSKRAGVLGAYEAGILYLGK